MEGIYDQLTRSNHMLIVHHDLEVELDDSWWTEAGMGGFMPRAPAYRTKVDAVDRRAIFAVRIVDIGPVRRLPGVGIFNYNEEFSARERVVSILTGFRLGAAIPPIELVEFCFRS